MSFNKITMFATAAAVLLLGAAPTSAQRQGGSRFQADNAQSTRTQPFGNARNRTSAFGDTSDQSDFSRADASQGGFGTSGLDNRRGANDGGFVGRDADDVRQTFNNLSGRERRSAAFDVLIENLNEMRESRRRWQAQPYAPPPVRIRFEPVFEYSTPAPATTQAAVQASLARAWDANGEAPTATIDGRTMTLRGTASTERDRKLAERMASLQPGVSRVDNQMTVAGATE